MAAADPAVLLAAWTAAPEDVGCWGAALVEAEMVDRATKLRGLLCGADTVMPHCCRSTIAAATTDCDLQR